MQMNTVEKLTTSSEAASHNLNKPNIIPDAKIPMT